MNNYEKQLNNLVQVLVPIHAIHNETRKIINDSLKAFRELLDENKKLKEEIEKFKPILEAWKIMKGNLVLNEENSNVKLSVCYRTKNYNKIKKALESKDEKEN